MKSSEKIIYGITKFGKILSGVVLVSCFILSVVCILGVIFARELYFEVLDTASFDHFGYFLKTFHISRYGELVTILLIGFIMCIAQAFLSLMCLTFFSHVLNTGHPFTRKLGRELRLLGIYETITPFVAYGLGRAMEVAMEAFFHESYVFHYHPCIFLPIGIMYIILSFFCDYASDLLFELRNEDQDSQK